MKPLIYLCLFLFSYTAVACEYFCEDYFEKYSKADLVLITEIDSLSITETKKREGFYEAFVNKKETIIVKGKLNNKLIGTFNGNIICGGSWTPKLNTPLIIYAYLKNNEYQFSVSACSHIIDYTDNYLLLKDHNNFIGSKNSFNKLKKNLELHFLLNNIQLTEKKYDTWPVVQPSKETSKYLYQHNIPQGKYIIYEVYLTSDFDLKKIKKLKGYNRRIDKEIKDNIKKVVWNKNSKQKEKYKFLLLFESIKLNFIKKAKAEYDRLLLEKSK